MKTITIPKRFGYPTLDITVNGKVYTVKSGEEITVEDSVAEAIENAIALAPKVGMSRNKIAQLAEGSITELSMSDLEGIETIAYYAFAYCKSLKSIEIPDNVKSIGNSVFTSCEGLKSVRFGDNSRLDSIGNNVFNGCKNLSSVHLPQTPPTIANINAFASINADCVFYCKTQASLAAYKKAPIWSTLTGTYSFVIES